MKQYNTKTLLAFLAVTALFFSSCQKEKEGDDLSTGKATVTVKVSGIGAEDDAKPLARAATSGKAASIAAVQQVTVPFGEDLVVRATLTEVKASEGTSLRAATNKAATTSTGPGQIVAFNGDYKIYIYKEGSSALEKTVDGKGAVANKFELAPGKYRFVVSAYGSPAGTGADKDPLSVEILQTVTAGNNNLDVVLKHKLTEVTVKFDAGSGRTISAISNSTVKPNYNYSFDEATGLVTFGTELAAKGFSFPTQAAAQTWTSSPVMIAVDNSNGTGEVKLANVTINSKPGNVSLTGLTLRKGVQYVLELDLGAKQGFEIGGGVWSDGNLDYDSSTGVYSFGAKNSPGNYWFPGRLLPKRLDGTNQAADGTNGGNGDPCSKVAPAGSWKLPTRDQYQTLITRTSPKQGTTQGQDNPNVTNPWYSSRYVDTYDGTNSTVLGMFFGVNTDNIPVVMSEAQRSKYIFFPYQGYYPNDNTGASIGNQGAYMATSNLKADNGYISFFLTGNKGVRGDGDAQFRRADLTEAVQIRCVKN
ncbi:MAG: hypothetical protein LBF27_21035 [Sphingobacterium sp.]|jgi:hypothetical protein|nr:hypothetical protein [Sphingobacterium sp.]